MHRPTLIFAILLALFAWGCSSKDGGGLSASKSAGPDIMGKWKGKIEMPKSEDEDNPFGKMAEAMAGMFTGNMALEFLPEDRFRLSFMGIPIEGKVERKGLDLTLHTDRAMGMTVEEAKKTNPDFKQETMLAKISADGSKITISDLGDDKSKGTMVFERAKEEPKKQVASTVSDAEKDLVGDYTAKMEGSPGQMDEKEQSEFKMAEAMMQTSTLELRADNTFKMMMMLEMEGTWKVEDGKISLHMTKIMGMPDDGKSTSKNDDMVLKVEPGGRLTTSEGGPKGMTLVFQKK